MTEPSPSKTELPLEAVSCYVCGRSDGKELVDDPPFKVKLCAGCGFGYTSPRIRGDRIHEIYDAGYFASARAEEFGYAAYSKDLDAYLRTFRRKLRVIRRFKTAGRLLEVGCAAGAFLKVTSDAGFEVTGIEVAEDILETARRRFGFERLHAGRIDQVPLPPRHFDVVAMFDVIEHVADPVAELRRLEATMKADGILVLQTQNVASFARRVLRSRWHHFKQLEHIYHFTPATLATVLERAGLEVVLNTRRHAGKYVSVGEVADRAHRVLHLPRWLCAPLRLASRRYVYVNPLDEMLVIARRKAVTPGG